MAPRKSMKQRRPRRPNPALAWGGAQHAIIGGSPIDVPDANLSDPAVRKGVYFNILPGDVVLPTRNGVKPSDMRFISFLLTVATGAQLATAGFITAYFTVDEDLPPASVKWDLMSVNAVLDFKEYARAARTTIGWHRTVAGVTGEIRTTFNISRSLSMKNFDTDDMGTRVGRVYFFYPAGLSPTVRLYAKCAFEGVEQASVPVSLSAVPSYDTLYDVVSLQFLMQAFKELARPVFFNAHSEVANVTTERGLFILYSAERPTAEDLSEPLMDLLIESDLTTYRPPLTGIVFPKRDEVTNLLSSSLTHWCRQKVIVESHNGRPAEYWWAHVQPDDFNVVSGRDVLLVDCYERLPTITPRNRTAAEVLSSCVAGTASLSVSANDRPAQQPSDFTPQELKRLVRLLSKRAALLNSSDSEDAERYDDQGGASYDYAPDQHAEEAAAYQERLKDSI